MQDTRKFGRKLPIENGSGREGVVVDASAATDNCWKKRFEAPHLSESAVNKELETYAPCGRRRAAEQV